MIKGYILTYNVNQRKSITLINYYLFGRLSLSKRKQRSIYYYYPGLLEDTLYYKISNGCYFTKALIDDYDGLIKIIPAILQIKKKNMIDAKNYWQEYITINELEVKNW